MMLDHHTRLSVAREHASTLRESMLAPKRGRRLGTERGQATARIYAFSKTRTQVERGAAA